MNAFLFRLIFLLAFTVGAAVHGQGDPMLDTNFYVISVSDWKGQVAVQTLSALDYDQLKRDVALENRARNPAYQNLKYDWRAQHAGTTTSEKPVHPPPFPLKQPTPRNFQLYGKYPAVELAEQARTPLQEQETQRRERREATLEREFRNLSEKQQSQREEKEYEQKEWLEKFIAEIRTVKMTLEMGFNPSRQAEAGGNKGNPSGRKTVTVKQGPRLGEIGSDLVQDGNLVGGGNLKKLK